MVQIATVISAHWGQLQHVLLTGLFFLLHCVVV